MTARVIPTRPGLLQSAWRAIQLAMLRWQLDCLRDERSHYVGLGMAGPIYLRNSYQQELALMTRARQFET